MLLNSAETLFVNAKLRVFGNNRSPSKKTGVEENETKKQSQEKIGKKVLSQETDPSFRTLILFVSWHSLEELEVPVLYRMVPKKYYWLTLKTM